MKIIIPIAGHSRRFLKAGYSQPKPFIDIDGKSMIERVCQMFSPEDEFIFVCLQGHLQNSLYRDILKNAAVHGQVIEIAGHEYGPVFSVLQSRDLILNKNEPMIVSYCDFTMQWNYQRFVQKSQQYEGAIAVFRGFHPASFGDTYYAYVRTNGNDEMESLREKSSFTPQRHQEYASTGVYYFESWQVFEKYARELIDQGISVGQEYYCSLLYNLMVRDGLRVGVFEVDKFICWGTPEDLEEYLFWSRYFNTLAQREVQKAS